MADNHWVAVGVPRRDTHRERSYRQLGARDQQQAKLMFLRGVGYANGRWVVVGTSDTILNAPSADIDGDGVLNGIDVDNDNDGLIDINYLEDLDYVRHNLRRHQL